MVEQFSYLNALYVAVKNQNLWEDKKKKKY